MSLFKLGQAYSRAFISEKLGGSRRSFFPHSHGRVVCGCFRLDLNEKAPREILPGVTQERVRWAHVFAGQAEAVPIFVERKRRSGEWIYEGNWRASGPPVESPGEVAELAAYAGRDDISMILRLEKATGKQQAGAAAGQ